MRKQAQSGRRRGESGAVSVELVATLPFIGLALLAAAQIAIAGAALWSAGIAARAGARAVAVGGDARPAARRALPASLRAGARVEEGNGVEVRVRVPELFPGLPPLGLRAHSSLDSDDAGP
jgi:hypothetical protein